MVRAAIGLVVVLAACGGPPDATPTPEPRPSVAADVRDRAQQAMDAFFAAMADPEVTYRVIGQLRAGVEDADGRPDVLVNTYFDVKGGEYAGGLDIHLRDPTVGGGFTVAVLDGTAHLISGFDTLESMDAPDSLHRPTSVQGLTAGDLVPLGMNEEGLFEFAVTPWLGGDPLGQWVDLGAVPEGPLPPRTELRWHDSRLFLDESGVPQRLEHSWMFAVEGEDAPVSGTIVEDFEGLGMYVTLAVPDDALGFLTPTSHDVAGEPWRAVDPEGGTARLDVTFPLPAQPVMLGIEGAIFFVSSHDADGELILDAILGHGDGAIEIPVGSQTLVAYYRTCNGGCARLDAPRELCEIDADIEEGRQYRLRVEINERNRAACALVEAR